MNADQTSDWYQQKHGEAKDYAGLSYPFQDLTGNPFLREWFAGKRGATVDALDVGCGKAAFLRDLKTLLVEPAGARLGRVTGIDLVRSPGNLFEEVSPAFEFLSCNVDGQPLPLPDGAFDFVSCNHVLEHVFYTENLLREFHRVVRPGGACVVSVPNLAAWVNRVMLLFGIQPNGTEVGADSISYGLPAGELRRRADRHKASGHIRDFTPAALGDVARAAGFEVRGWWNQDHKAIFRLTKHAGRNVGVILHRT